MTTSVKKFVQTPLTGDKVKVYFSKGSFMYGVVRKIIIGNDEEEKCIIQGEIAKRQIVVVKQTQTEYSLSQIDYFLTEKKVKIIN